MARQSSMCACLAVLSLVPTVATAGAREKPRRPPNVVVILVDDLGWADLGCTGSKYYRTPHIDKLAAAGMRFTQGYAAAAICSPTRAALMTGRYPARLGLTDWIRARFNRGGGTPDANPTEYVGGPGQRLLCPPNPYWLELSEVTLAELLRRLGYATCHIGKWHLGDDAWYPQQQGFDYNFGGCDYGQPPSYFDPFVNKKLPQGIPGLPGRKEGEFLTDREADEAVNFIRKHKDRPFFLNLAHYAVHTPIMGKADVVERYKNTPAATDQKNPVYAALVESVDDAVGRVLAALREAGIEDNTLVIFTSDNGGLLPITSNLPLRSGKGYAYEGGIRVPLLVRWPGVVPPGSVSHQPAITMDLFSTVLEATGATPPQDRPIDGISLLPHLRSGGKEKLARDALFWHFPHYRHEPGPYSIARVGDWKLTKFYEGPAFELYDLKADPYEKKNLAEKMPAKVEELHGRMERWLKDTGAKLPRPNPDYRPGAGQPKGKGKRKAANKTAAAAEAISLPPRWRNDYAGSITLKATAAPGLPLQGRRLHGSSRLLLPGLPGVSEYPRSQPA